MACHQKVYQKLFDGLKDEYDIIYVPLLGPDKRYPIDNHWNSLTNQVVDSLVRQAKWQQSHWPWCILWEQC